MTLVVPPALVPTVLGKTAPPPPLQAQALAGALAQGAQQRATSAAARTETRDAVRRLAKAERARPTEEKRLPEETDRRGGLLDVSA